MVHRCAFDIMHKEKMRQQCRKVHGQTKRSVELKTRGACATVRLEHQTSTFQIALDCIRHTTGDTLCSANTRGLANASTIEIASTKALLHTTCADRIDSETG